MSTSELAFARYSGLNESSSFKSPLKLSAIVYFRAPRDASGKPTGEEKQTIVYEQINDLLVKGLKEHEVQDRIRKFISKCREGTK